MRLEEVYAAFAALDFPMAGERAHPSRDTILHARATIGEALRSTEFLTDCISHELQLISSGALRHGLTPFWTMPALGARLAFGYWRPGEGPGPHEHTAWTITAVCRNRLDVATFDRDESYRRGELVPKNLFEAQAGQVGSICEPAIHAPRNNSDDWSFSLHISSPRDGEPIEGVEPLPGLYTGARVPGDRGHPYMAVVGARERQRLVRLLVPVLVSIRSPGAHRLLARSYRLGTASTRRLIADLLPMPDHGPVHPQVLTRTNPNLPISIECNSDGVAVIAATPRGARRQLVVNAIAYDALAFAATHTSFEVAALPGGLSGEESVALAEMLEESGLFQRPDVV